jgi:tRNA pseudouridine55 synthase
VGSATKKFSELLNLKKEYEMEVCFGEERDTDDITGEVVSQYRGEVLLGRDIIEKVLSEHFLGKIIQTPPKYSAIKIGGKRAYDLSRKKKSFIVPRREVEIYESDVLEVKKNILKVRLIVSSGTYLRSVARDLGKILGFGAYAKSLRRTKVGGYKVEDAERLEQLSEKHKT